MTRIVVVAFALAVIIFTLGGGAAAQDSCKVISGFTSVNNACLLHWGWDDFPDPNAPATMVCCNPNGVPFNETCVARRYTCGPPPDAADNVCLTCQTHEAGGPISLSNGNTYITESDISVPGLGGGLNLARTWNSKLPSVQKAFSFMFGTNWRSTYEERLIFTGSADGYLKYLRTDGSVWSFGVDTAGSPNVYKAAAPANDTRSNAHVIPVSHFIRRTRARSRFRMRRRASLSASDNVSAWSPFCLRSSLRKLFTFVMVCFLQYAPHGALCIVDA